MADLPEASDSDSLWARNFRRICGYAHQSVKQNESTYSGVYNATLSKLFKVEDGYEVSPQHTPEGWRGALDFGVLYILGYRRHDALFLELKAPAVIHSGSTRAKADEQMRERFKRYRDMTGERSIKIPKLYGISAIGFHLCIYSLDMETGQINPPEIPKEMKLFNDTAPADWWNLHIESAEGWERLSAIAKEVKAMFEAADLKEKEGVTNT